MSEVGTFLGDRRTGKVLEIFHEGFERSGTKERVVYECRVIFPKEAEGETVSVSVYSVDFPDSRYTELTEMEVIAWASR